MAQRHIVLVLQDKSHIESAESSRLRGLALSLIKPLEDTLSSPLDIEAAKPSSISDTSVELLEQVIKPLFSKSQHPKLTSTGRKNLVNNSLPASATRFLFDDDSNRPVWKNGWAGDLLTYILQSYARIPDLDLRRKTFEAKLHSFVPAILQMLDDMDITWKRVGCRCLRLFCVELSTVGSTFLRKSGLMDVFVEALKNDFSLLPTLTPEEDSLELFGELYPAYRSLVKARFIDGGGGTNREGRGAGTNESEEDKRQAYLTLLLRHQLLHSLNHLSTGTGAGSTSSVSLSTFFISQLGWIFEDMGIASVMHLQTILPLLRNVLMDPFATSSPQMLLEAVQAMQVIVQGCWVRIRDLWWSECLRGVVVCWVNVVDELDDVKEKRRRRSLQEVQKQLKILCCLLEDIIGRESFESGTAGLVAEEPALLELLDGKIGGWEVNSRGEERFVQPNPSDK